MAELGIAAFRDNNAALDEVGAPCLTWSAGCAAWSIWNGREEAASLALGVVTAIGW